MLQHSHGRFNQIPVPTLSLPFSSTPPGYSLLFLNFFLLFLGFFYSNNKTLRGIPSVGCRGTERGSSGMLGYRDISGRLEGFESIPAFRCELSASMHMAISASAGRTGFSREKCVLAKRSEVLSVPRRAAAAPGAAASIRREMLKSKESSKASSQQLPQPPPAQDEGNCFAQGCKKKP